MRNAHQKVLGWYIYYLKSGGVSDVLHIAGTKDSFKLVLNHLFYHARRHGSLALTGRLEPKFSQALSESYCFFRWTGPWTLVHSKDPEILKAILRGEAFLTRLEGEWCFLFAEESSSAASGIQGW